MQLKHLLVLVIIVLVTPEVTAAVYEVNFTSSGTWNAPTGVLWAYVEAYGGGGGAGRARGNPSTAGGGGGGGYAATNITAVAAGSYTISVGAAGAASSGTGTDTQHGGWGGNSTFNGTTVRASGGGRGLSDTNINNGNGAGGSGGCSNNIGTISRCGGNGAQSSIATARGGGGGGAGGTTTNAANATLGTGTAGGGGAAGNGANGTTAAGAAGSNYGGGASGGYASGATDRDGGGGAAGFVRITYERDPVYVYPYENKANISTESTLVPGSTEPIISNNTVIGMYAAKFNTSDSTRLDSPSTAQFNLSGQSFSVAWRVQMSSSAANQWVFRYGDSSTAWLGFIWTGTQQNFIREASTYTFTGIGASVGVWNTYFLIFNNDDSSVTLYVNGSVVSDTSSGAAPTSPSSTARMQISGRDNNFYFGGNFTDLRIWRGHLSSTEVSSYSSFNRNINCTQLIGWYNFEPNQVGCSSSPPTDTCTYSGSGDWNIAGSDNCVISTSVDLNGANVIATGPGTLTITGSSGRIFDTPLVRFIGGLVVTVIAGARIG